jgi:hypothetical protein
MFLITAEGGLLSATVDQDCTALVLRVFQVSLKDDYKGF